MKNEKRLIYVDDLIDEIRMADERQKTDVWLTSDLEYLLEQQPTVEAVEVVHGRWEPELMPTGVEYTGYPEMTVQALSCSVCGKCIDVSEGYFSYCPNCGADMRGIKDDL